MKKKMLQIREEKREDHRRISEITLAAFAPLGFETLTEHLIIGELRKAGALTISLVAQVNDEPVGHIAFSPVTISDGSTGWYVLGPVSVAPEHQKQGTGGELIREGLARLRQAGAAGCCLVGHPEYYRRFGFENVNSMVHEGVHPDYCFALSFTGGYPSGEVFLHEAFQAGE